MSNKICAGILAQVDAGKTTLCESILYVSKVIRKKGSVDSGNTFFDYNTSEIQHGITVFSKEASFLWGDASVAIIDTPGHRDFVSEVERILPITDVLIFVLSAYEIDKQQNIRLFKKLSEYNKPIILFISKMDMGRTTVREVMDSISSAYSENCVYYANGKPDPEAAATVDETYLEAFLEEKNVSAEHIRESILRKSIFPALFGSGMTGEGVEELLNLLALLSTSYSKMDTEDKACAYVYKIDRDSKGGRQAHVRVLKGTYSARDNISITVENTPFIEKITEIRQINGARYANLPKAEAGDIAVFTGLMHSAAGMYLGEGIEAAPSIQKISAALLYELYCATPQQKDKLAEAVRILQEEDPTLRIKPSESEPSHYFIRLRGALQKELIADIFKKRFDLAICFGDPGAEYYETIKSKVYGNGHYEPLRHYAEVQLELTPLPEGSGIQVISACPEDALGINWQNAILYYLKTTAIRGVLTGSPITDIKISLINGRAHIKHTEGGDFREAAIRAARQALMKADCVLLEPFAGFTIVCPTGITGKILAQMEPLRLAVQSQQINSQSLCEISGSGPLIQVDTFRKQLISERGDSVYFEYMPSGFKPCAIADKIVGDIGYKPEADLSQSPDSVFCSHGAGHTVKWDEADRFMHTDIVTSRTDTSSGFYSLTESELKDILRRNALLDEKTELRHIAREAYTPNLTISLLSLIYLVDGSNVLYEYIKSSQNNRKTENDAHLFKNELVSLMINYFKFIGASAKIVFDGSAVSDIMYDELSLGEKVSVLFSGNESGDILLERLAKQIGPDYRCKMVTSDRLVQVSAFHAGITRISSAEFLQEMQEGIEKMRSIISTQNKGTHFSISDCMHNP